MILTAVPKMIGKSMRLTKPIEMVGVRGRGGERARGRLLNSHLLPLPHSPTLLASVLALLLAFAPASAADLAPSWTALPDETVGMLRIPGGEAFLDALRRQTKLGAVVLSQDRIERVVQIIRERSQKELEELREALGRVDLKPDDWQGLFRGDLGLAVVLEPRADRAPLVVLLGWLEPGEELAPRLLTALQSALEDAADEEFAPRRQDSELAGHKVLQLDIPVPGITAPQLPDLDDDDDNSNEKLQQQIDKFKDRLNDAKQAVTDHVHVFVSRLGGRIVFASTVPQSSGEVKGKTDAEREAIDWDALTGLDQATAVFGRFLAAHDVSASGGIRRLFETPGLESSLPGGTALLELLVDPRPLIQLADLAKNPKVKQVLEAVGVAGLGPLAVRISLDGIALRSGAFLSMPAPRPGLLTLFDQAKLDPEPPAWVPASAAGYQQFSFDLGKAYQQVKDLVIEQSAGAARQSFDQLETTVKAFLQVDFSDVLSSLGQQHTAVSFLPKIGEVAPANNGEQAVTPQLVQPVGIVWKLGNEQVWKQILQLIGRFAQGGAAGGLQAVEEQGFSGYRMQQGNNQMGLFVGNGYLVLGVGSDVSESLLSVLRSPPEGEAAMRSSGLVERGRALIPPQPCLSYQLSDAGASVKVTRQLLNSLLEAPLSVKLNAPPAGGIGAGLAGLAAQPSAEQKELIEKLKSLLPNDAELEGVMGVSIGQTVVTDDGLAIQSAVELPAP